MSLILKIDYQSEIRGRNKESTLNLETSRLLTAAEVCRSVYQRLNEKGELKQPTDAYALYWPEEKVWLKNGVHIGRMLRKSSNTNLQYRCKSRPLKLRYLDGSSKQILIDETQTVAEIVIAISKQLAYDFPEELCIVVAGDYTVNKHHPAKQSDHHLSPMLLTKKDPLTTSDSSIGISPKIRRRTMSSSRPASASSMRSGSATKARRSSTSLLAKKKRISKKHQMRIDTPWLDPSKTLLEQEVNEDDELILMYRFHYHAQLNKESSTAELLYKQARATYLSGELLCSRNDMVNFSALLYQIMKGDFTSKEETLEYLHKLKGLIVPPKCKIKSVAKDIVAHHSLLAGVTACDAKSWFVKLWSSMELFGMEMFSCVNADTKESGLIGISKYKIIFLFYNTKKKSLMWDYSSLLHWELDSSSSIVVLSFNKDGMTDKLKLSLPDYAAVMADCLKGHRDLSASVPDLSPHRQQQEYMLDEHMEAAYNQFTAGQVGKVRPQSLTYNQIYWASMIENPLATQDEVKNVSWENPAFGKMDQLMEERFNFLDFKEYNADDSSDSAGLSLSSARESPLSLNRLTIDSSETSLLKVARSDPKLAVENGSTSSSTSSPESLRGNSPMKVIHRDDQSSYPPQHENLHSQSYPSMHSSHACSLESPDLSHDS